ncbi:MAG TPA: hypothetical protein VMS89_01925 [Methanoregulaceae archaeon]|nr:hypothetical protein [Methanoregulaceae archaeon]
MLQWIQVPALVFTPGGEGITPTEQIRTKLQRVYANIVMIEGLLDLVDKGKDDPEIWRAADKLMLDIVSILNSVSMEIESHYSE